MGLWVRAHATVKNMGSMGDSDAEKGGLLSLTYASRPEWDCPPRDPNTFVDLVGKVRKNHLPKKEGRNGGEKSAHRAPAGPGLEPGTCRVLGEGPGLHARGAV